MEPRVIEALTPREGEVLGLLREGLTDRQLAARLGIARLTVCNHLSNIYLKIGARNRLQAALMVERCPELVGEAPLPCAWHANPDECPRNRRCD